MFKRPGIHIQHFNDGRVIYFSTTTAQWLPSYPQAGKSAILACSQHRYIRWQGNPHPFTIDQRWERYLHLFTTVYWQATCFFLSRSGHFNDGRVKTKSLTIFPLYFRHFFFFFFFFNPWDASSRGSQSRRRTELPSTGQWGQPQWVPGVATQTIREDDNALVVVKTWLILNEAVYAKLNMLWQGNKKKSCFPFIKKSQFFPPQSCQIQENNRVDQQKNHPTKV